MGLGDPSQASPGARWDLRYAEAPWPSDPDEALVELTGSLPPGRALDLGCGPGRNAVFLARRGWTVTGVDASAVGLAQAAARAAAAGVDLDLVQADVLDEELGRQRFDLVVIANLHFPPGQRERFFERVVAALAPGGHCYLAGRHLDSAGGHGPSAPERRYTEALVTELLVPLSVATRRLERPAEGGGPPVVKLVAWATAPSPSPGDGD